MKWCRFGLVTLVISMMQASGAKGDAVLPDLDPALVAAAPVSLLSDHPETSFIFRDSSPKESPAKFVVTGQQGRFPVFTADVTSASRNTYAVETRWDTAQPVKKGDVVLVRFAARALKAKQESGEAAIAFYFQRAGEPFDKSVSITISAPPEWSVYTVPFVVHQDFKAGEASANFGLGALVQTVEITGLEVLNFGTRVNVRDLPITKFTYAGREEGAAWREEALKRIEEIRTAPVTVRVVDAQGNPVGGANVDIAMTQSKFYFGTEVDADFLQDKSPAADRHRELLKELFNTVTIGNGLKWGRWMSPERRKNTLASLDWLLESGFRVRGHNLVWPGWNFTPKSIKEDPDRATKLEGQIEDHIREIVTATRGKLVCWDVVNEPVHETDYFQIFPRETMVKWYDLVRSIDPNAQLVINEYGMLNGSGSTTMISQFVDLVRFLRERGAKIDVLGVQGHIGQQPRDPKSVLSDLNLLAQERLPIEITEFDVETRDEQLQADYTRDFLIACYSHPSVQGFVMWGFYEARHWKPTAAMYRPDWSEKPNGKVWRDLVIGQWKTHVTKPTGDDGKVEARGHLGKYTVTVTANGKKTTAELDLEKAGSSVEIQLK